MAAPNFSPEDQQNINTFSKLNAKLHELEALINIQQSNVDDLEEASNELMLVDDEEVMYCMGEGFVQTPVSEAEEKITEASAKAQEEFDSLKQQKEEVEGKMADLKEVLYGKFGREHINLEE